MAGAAFQWLFWDLFFHLIFMTKNLLSVNQQRGTRRALQFVTSNLGSEA
jgi:hypothetical protein